MYAKVELSKSNWLFLWAIAFFSMWIRMNFHIFAVGWAAHDDLLFVQLAANIGMGNWLGDYSNLTHAKGVGYSIFLLINHALGLPLKFGEHAAYLGAAFFLAITMGRLLQSRVAVFAFFAVLALMPTVWAAAVAGRVVREGIYVTQSILIVSLGIHCWILGVGRDCSVVESLKNNWGKLTLLGVAGGWFWITREEGVWLFPALLILMGGWIWQQKAYIQNWKPIAAYLLLPLVSASVVVGVVNTINYFEYGVFRNNDFRSSDFKSGYGALTRIRHDQWQRYVLFPADARQRAYAMSAAARELQPFFEGQGAANWRKVGCDQTATQECPEILSGWFMWALRDAVAAAGHYKDAQTASAFYQRLSAEIDAGCRQRPEDCLPDRATMLPPWRSEYVGDTLKASWDVFKTLSTFGNVSPHKLASVGTQEQLWLFEVVTNGPLSPADPALLSPASPRDKIREKIAFWLFKIVKAFSGIGLPLALLAWLIWSIVCLVKRQPPSAAWLVATALSAAIVIRVVLLGLLEVTSMPSNNMLYLFPVAPFSLVMIIFMVFATVRGLSFKK